MRLHEALEKSDLATLRLESANKTVIIYYASKGGKDIYYDVFKGYLLVQSGKSSTTDVLFSEDWRPVGVMP